MAGFASIATTEKWIGNRSEERKAVIGSITFSGIVGNHGFISIDGVTANVSKSGACVYTRHKLEEGLTCSCCSKAVGNEPREARIVWSRRISKKVFVAGISFAG